MYTDTPYRIHDDCERGAADDLKGSGHDQGQGSGGGDRERQSWMARIKAWLDAQRYRCVFSFFSGGGEAPVQARWRSPEKEGVLLAACVDFEPRTAVARLSEAVACLSCQLKGCSGTQRMP